MKRKEKTYCKEPLCDRTSRARGYCKPHYEFHRRCVDFQTKSRQVWREEKIERVTESGCLIWMGRIDTCGYGRIYIRQIDKKRICIGAHRFFYQLHYGEIPEGKQVLHDCDTPSCVNPHHLFLGTRRDNMMDASRKGRLAVCRKGENHPASKFFGDTKTVYLEKKQGAI